MTPRFDEGLKESEVQGREGAARNLGSDTHAGTTQKRVERKRGRTLQQDVTAYIERNVFTRWIEEVNSKWKTFVTLGTETRYGAAKRVSTSIRDRAKGVDTVHATSRPAALLVLYSSPVVNLHDTWTRYTPNRLLERTAYPWRIQRRVEYARIAYQAPKKREVSEGESLDCGIGDEAGDNREAPDETRTIEDTAAVTGAICAGLLCELNAGATDTRNFYVFAPQAFAVPVDERIGTWLEDAARAGERVLQGLVSILALCSPMSTSRVHFVLRALNVHQHVRYP
ncbi:hypothetical protein NMY22_g12460 [Coprinellus aureogranulatus]|nr:hypothetical protein NMY22_g12460 [Coprinellus aureogranulatus]